MSRLRKYAALIFALCLAALPAGSALAQSEAPNLFYIDSVKAGPGRDIAIGFKIRNDQSLSALTLPVTYDQNLLTLRSVSFAGSRGEYLGTKMVAPEDIATADGHFAVGLLRIFEDPIPVGDGLMFTAVFRVSDTVSARMVTTIDSLFYPPANEVIFVDAANSNIIYPEFVPGKVFIDATNEGPSIQPIPEQFVFEGDTLAINVVAVDGDGDKLRLICTERPTGAAFTDNGDGTGSLVWHPPFVGPSSADGDAVETGFWVSDGDLSDKINVVINVLNKNQAPRVTVADSTVINAGESLSLTVNAFEPDFEPLTWACRGLPPGAAFDGKFPGEFAWSSTVIDTGLFKVDFIATDPQGLADTGSMMLNVMPVDIFTLTTDTASAFPNDDVSIGVLLENKLAVSSFKLLLNYDAATLTLMDVTNAGTRTKDFEYFTYTDQSAGVPGHVKIEGVAHISESIPDLASGNGAIASLDFHIINNLTAGGATLPIRFITVDSTNYTDNTLTDSSGARIEQTQIVYSEGYVHVLEVGLIRIGDVNLNGVAYEVSDVVYFYNYLMNPTQYPFDVLQYANSDINGDGIVASLADLIALINEVTGNNSIRKVSSTEGLSANVWTTATEMGTSFSYDAGFEVGGVFAILNTTDEITVDDIRSPFGNITLLKRIDSTEVRILLFSVDGLTMPPGGNVCLEIDNLENFDIEKIELASADGEAVSVVRAAKEVALPEEFALHQNYPNPFNPQTTISFDLAAAARAEMAVYNVLGQEVRLLIDGYLPAGKHSVVWDGRDDNNQQVSSGVYFYRLVSQGNALTRKMIMLK